MCAVNTIHHLIAFIDISDDTFKKRRAKEIADERENSAAVTPTPQ